ncbi:MAG TPA: hypoxanthine phosphoribosyltransferase [Chloroflexota bacterium]|nr:hypoxanthine phosphoribosyltransferase [Chloroflexota bacterium]
MQLRTRLSHPATCHPDVAGVLVSERALARRVRELGAEISRDYAGREILLVGVLRAGLVFLADLARAISVPVRVDCLAAASYGAGTSSSGAVRITRDLDESLAGRHVLVVDTVLDTGLTLRALDAALRARGPASVRYCVLLQKDRGGPPPFRADYVGFTIPDRFVVGYGLDYAQRFRNLPYVGVLRRPVYEGTS